MLQSKVFAKSCRELGLKYIAQNPIRPRPMARPNASSRPHSGNGLMLSHTQPQITARLWRSLKYECVFLNAYETGSEARSGIGSWIDYYNRQRPHSTFGGRTPDEVYATADMTERLAA